MRDGALLVNVARGAVVDTDALVAETSTGRLRAALDVTDPEPLPPDHPLWRIPGVFVTPHVAGATPDSTPRMARLVRAAGRPDARRGASAQRRPPLLSGDRRPVVTAVGEGA